MIKIFISSVQAELAEERTLLKAYIEKSPLLRRFFSVFVFEADVPPTDRRTDEVYLEELRNSDLYLLLIGNRYGSRTEDGISPTEREYDEATKRGIQRLAFVRDEPTGREPQELQFLSKVSKDVIWHSFADRLEIYNPGSINPALTPEMLKERHGSFPNNPLIAEPLYLTKYIERLGSGLTDLIEHCRAVGLPDPEFYIDRFEFGIVIRRKGVGGVTDPVTDPVNDGVRSVLDVIANHPGIRRNAIAKLLGVSDATGKRRIKLFGHKVEFRGAPKNGGYYVR